MFTALSFSPRGHRSLRSLGRSITTVMASALLVTGVFLVPQSPAQSAPPDEPGPPVNVEVVPGSTSYYFVTSGRVCHLSQVATGTMPVGFTAAQRETATGQTNRLVGQYDDGHSGIDMTDVTRTGRTLNVKVETTVPGVSPGECQRAGDAFAESQRIQGILGTPFWRKVTAKISGALTTFALDAGFAALAVIFPEAAIQIGAIGGCIGSGAGTLVYYAVLGTVTSKDSVFNSVFNCVSGAVAGGVIGGLAKAGILNSLRDAQQFVRAGLLRERLEAIVRRFAPTWVEAVEMATRA
jgi:hypothetical protein